MYNADNAEDGGESQSNNQVDSYQEKCLERIVILLIVVVAIAFVSFLFCGGGQCL